MLPYSENTENTENTDDLELEFEEEELEQTKTYGLNSNGTNIIGMVDELDALKQSIYIKLNIEADQFIIYPYTYGLVTIDLIGKPVYYVMAVIPGRIKETLMSDDRVTDVSDFEFEATKNKLTVKFVVSTIYGADINTETVVTY